MRFSTIAAVLVSLFATSMALPTKVVYYQQSSFYHQSGGSPQRLVCSQCVEKPTRIQSRSIDVGAKYVAAEDVTSDNQQITEASVLDVTEAANVESTPSQVLDITEANVDGSTKISATEIPSDEAIITDDLAALDSTIEVATVLADSDIAESSSVAAVTDDVGNEAITEASDTSSESATTEISHEEDNITTEIPSVSEANVAIPEDNIVPVSDDLPVAETRIDANSEQFPALLPPLLDVAQPNYLGNDSEDTIGDDIASKAIPAEANPEPLPAGTFFPIKFDSASGGAIAIANSFSTGDGGSASSHAIAYGQPEANKSKLRANRRH